MSNLKRSRLDELKIKACLLFKSLKDKDPEECRKAAERFSKLPFLQSKSAEEILSDTSFLKLKHALLLMAIENGCSSWTALREKIIEEDCLYYENWSAFLNHWFANYAEAKSFHNANDGYLLQYRQHYFICQEDFIEQLGLDAYKEEWKAIAYDWTKKDNSAWEILFTQAKHNYLNRQQQYSKPEKSKRPDWIKA